MYAMSPDTPSSSGSDTPHPPVRSAEEKLMVAVRIRPLKHDEPHRILHNVNNKTVLLEDVGRSGQKKCLDKRYSFDVVFGENSSQEEVYDTTTSNLVKDVLNGYNATVFAYGPTGAGKTFTMVGDKSQPGIMIRALNDIFKAVQEKQDEFTVSLSYLEIYNEQIRDLLNPSSGYLDLREDSRERSIQVAGLSEISTTNTEEVMLLLQKGNKARTVEPTAMNQTSSRSHALLSVVVRHGISISKNDHLKMRVRQGRMFMIDLAGSERANKTKNRGKRLQEGGHINRSLLALGNCINALAGGARYVNYRDSKLTRLLKDALSGNCRTVMIAHVCPSVDQKDETRNTLVYADRAKNISTKAGQNIVDVGYQVSQYQTVVNELRQEISRLQNKISEQSPRLQANGDDINRNASTTEKEGKEVKMIREQIVETFKTQMKLRRKLMEIDAHILGLGMEAERQHLIISHWESKKNKLYKNTPTTRPRTYDSTRSLNDSREDFESDIDETNDDTAIQQAWIELADIEREQDRWSELKTHIEQKLESCRQRGVALENKLPEVLSSDDEREILALICRVHELEADKMALQSERLVRQHELKKRDLLIMRYDRQRQLSEEIITRQRKLIEGFKIKLTPDLQELYQIYQQEIHATSYADVQASLSSRGFEALPPIQRGDKEDFSSSPPSSSDSGPELDASIDRVMGQMVSRSARHSRLPILPPSPPIRIPHSGHSRDW